MNCIWIYMSGSIAFLAIHKKLIEHGWSDITYESSIVQGFDLERKKMIETIDTNKKMEKNPTIVSSIERKQEKNRRTHHSIEHNVLVVGQNDDDIGWCWLCCIADLELKNQQHPPNSAENHEKMLKFNHYSLHTLSFSLSIRVSIEAIHSLNMNYSKSMPELYKLVAMKIFVQLKFMKAFRVYVIAAKSSCKTLTNRNERK